MKPASALTLLVLLASSANAATFPQHLPGSIHPPVVNSPAVSSPQRPDTPASSMPQVVSVKPIKRPPPRTFSPSTLPRPVGTFPHHPAPIDGAHVTYKSPISARHNHSSSSSSSGSGSGSSSRSSGDEIQFLKHNSNGSLEDAAAGDVESPADKGDVSHTNSTSRVPSARTGDSSSVVATPSLGTLVAVCVSLALVL